MYYERLALEVNATIAGLGVSKPSALKGKSGVMHRFAFLATDGSKQYGFDIYSEVDEVAILRSFVKKVDTEAQVFVVCLSGRAQEEATDLASKYGIEILTPGEVGDFFSKRIAQLMKAPQSTLKA